VSDVTTEQMVEAALAYAERGWKVMPLKARDKVPVLKAWQQQASSEQEHIEHWWSQSPDANLGVQLGQRSGIIDVECDTKDAEQSLHRMFKHDSYVVPCFQASRGKHRIFKWTPDLPPGAVVKVEGVEFRIGGGDLGAQSVFPPSKHPSGATYQWLVHPDEVEPAELPLSVRKLVIEAYHAKKGGGPRAPGAERVATDGDGPKSNDEWARIASGVGEGERHSSAASLIGKLISGLKDPSDNSQAAILYRMVSAWNETNKPPIHDDELKRLFTDLLRSEREKAIDSDFAVAMSKYTPVDQQAELLDGELGTRPEAQDGESPPPEPEESSWKLVIVESRPRSYKLYSHMWAGRCEGGYIVIPSSEKLLSGQAMRQAVLEQADLYLPKDFVAYWDGTMKRKGMAAQLMDTASREAAAEEARRDLVIAAYLYEAIRKPRIVDGDKNKEPDSMGKPSLMPDGSVVFKFEAVWVDMKRSDDQITRNELSGVLKYLGAGTYQWGPKDTRQRFKQLKADCIKRLHEFIGLVE
jgi:hypothetical protein